MKPINMGFEPQICCILSNVPDPLQTLLFSALLPKEIQCLAFHFLRDPIQINVSKVGSLVGNKDINQTIVMYDDREKRDSRKSWTNSLATKDTLLSSLGIEEDVEVEEGEEMEDSSDDGDGIF